jgi:D-alanine-D-alanine ligase
LRFWKVTESLIWMNTTSDIEENLKKGAIRIKYEDLKKVINFAFLGLHGKFVEDGALQGLLEILEVRYNGPRILGSAVGMDKVFQKKILKSKGINVVKHIAVEGGEFKDSYKAILTKIKKEIGFPCIVKPSREGCSTGLSKVEKSADFKTALKKAFKWDRQVLIEKFMTDMEVTCTILGNEEPFALLPTETPAKGDFLTVEEKFLPGDAQMITPPRVPKKDVVKMQKEFIKAYIAMDLCVYTRIDGFWDKVNKILYISEPNTLPGVTPSTHVFHQAAEADMTPSEFFDKVIAYSLELKSQ